VHVWGPFQVVHLGQVKPTPSRALIYTHSHVLSHITQSCTCKQVTTSSVDMDHTHIHITHAEPYFTPEELQERRTKFERENKISQFVFETPFTPDGKQHGDITRQCMRKTILTSTWGGHIPIPENPAV